MITAQLSYSKYTTMQNNERVVNDQLFYYIQSAHTILLPKDFRTEATFLYSGPAAAAALSPASPAPHRPGSQQIFLEEESRGRCYAILLMSKLFRF